MVALLLACVFITPGDAAARRDLDGDGYVSTQWGGDDCDDRDAAINPGAREVCNGVDDDCNGGEDDVTEGPSFYLDRDRDGFGDPETGLVLCAEDALGRVEEAGDCDDSDPAVNPEAEEICNDIDDDCDGGIDDQDPEFSEATFYLDADSDGYGDELESITEGSCSVPEGYVVEAGDCADDDPAVNPGATEICGGGDEDCDGQVDQADDSLDTTTLLEFYEDVDGDGYGGGELLLACEQPEGLTSDQSDCDEADPQVNPGMLESCHTDWDDDCDGITDACTYSRTEANYTFKPPESGQGAGTTLAVGDFDGDGVQELAVGAPDAGFLYEVVAPIFSDGSVTETRIEGEVGFGSCLVPADSNQDGDTELLVCSPAVGSIALMGGSLTLADGVVATFTGATGSFGESAAWIDTGATNLRVVGGDPGAGVDDGSVFLFGVAGGDKAASDALGQLYIAGGSWTESVGRTVGSADTDGDGRQELVATSDNATDGRYELLVLASWSGNVPDSDAMALTDLPGPACGLVSGDVDGDGREDLLVGIANNGKAERGEVLVFLNKLSTYTQANEADIQIEGTGKSGLGSTIVLLQDRDGDGTQEIFLGAPGASEALLFHGGLSVGSYGPMDASLVLTGTNDGTGTALAEGELGSPSGTLGPTSLWDLVVGAPDARSGSGMVALIEGERVL